MRLLCCNDQDTGRPSASAIQLLRGRACSCPRVLLKGDPAGTSRHEWRMGPPWTSTWVREVWNRWGEPQGFQGFSGSNSMLVARGREGARNGWGNGFGPGCYTGPCRLGSEFSPVCVSLGSLPVFNGSETKPEDIIGLVESHNTGDIEGCSRVSLKATVYSKPSRCIPEHPKQSFHDNPLSMGAGAPGLKVTCQPLQGLASSS